MSPARRAARAGRNLLLTLLLGAAIIVALVAAYVAGRNASPPSAAPATPLDQPTATAKAGETSSTAPTGCISGGAVDNEMLLEAQSQATHTSYGAVEMAAAFARWAYRFPYPTREQAAEVSRAVIAPNASASYKDIAAGYANAADITSGQVPRGTPFHLSTVDGVWVISSDSTDNKVTVELSGPIVVNDAVSATKSAALSATLVWNGGRWRVLSQQKPDVYALRAGGTQFTAGC